jgi:folate-dependent phosphoribosylglycinamide formyltransferase PurN
MLTVDVARVAVLCSGRAPGLTYLVSREMGHVVGWDVVCCLTSEESFEEEAEVAAAGVPVIRHPVGSFYAQHAPGASRRDLATRRRYDAETVRMLQPFRPDLIVLSGYLLLLTAPMLRAFSGRIINVHHADLALRNAQGGPRYPGLRAVRDAILAGERETRSSAHLVTERLDDGPVLLRSQPFPVPEISTWARAAGHDDVLRRVIWAHQEWMLRSAFGPLMERAIERLALLECVQ